jgi:hypothetical protein
MTRDIPLTHVFVPAPEVVPGAGEHRVLKRLDEITLDEARWVIRDLVDRVEAAEEEAAAMRLLASHTAKASKRAKYATNRTRRP